MNTDRLKGIIVPIITPIDKNERVDEDGFRKLLRHTADNGIHGIFVAGSNGESTSLLPEERNRAIKIAIDEVGKDVPVLCGALESGTNKVINSLKAIEQMGAEFAVVTSTYYIRHSCDFELISHFEKIARNTSLNIIIYNIPPFTQINISPDVVFELSYIENIIGLKDSSGNYLQFQRYLQHFKDSGFKIFQGITDIAGVSMFFGADGCIPVLAPLFPEIFIDLYEAATKYDLDNLMAVQKWISRTGNILRMGSNAVSSAKFAISLLGFTDKHATAPCKPLTVEEEAKIVAHYNQIKEEYKSIKEKGKDIA